VKVVHVITGLETGGAEAMLTKLALASASEVEQSVVSLRDHGTHGPALEAAGIEVTGLGLHRGASIGAALRAIRAQLSAPGPTLLHAWMYHANVLGGVAAVGTGRPVLWNIRANRISADVERVATVALARLSGLPARYLADAIVCNSDAAIAAHAGWGYPRRRMRRIDNGFDTERLRPDAAERSALRQRLGLPKDATLIGALGRFSPIKGHAVFAAACSEVLADPRVHAVLAGPGVEAAAPVLRAAMPPDMQTRFHVLPATPAERFFPTLDLAVLPSLDEAFPNVLGEAMACGTPTVATDVGDCARVAGSTGLIVPAGNAAALAAGIRTALGWSREERESRGRAARERITQQFALSRVTERYLALYREFLAR
jgi:glycosyltransferase involved in cell wall biosynthesis